MDNEKRIMDAFIKAGKPLSAKEASELSGLEKKEVDKLIKKLRTGKIGISQRCCAVSSFTQRAYPNWHGFLIDK